MQDVYLHSVKTYGDRPFVGTKHDNQYHWKTYKEIDVIAREVG